MVQPPTSLPEKFTEPNILARISIDLVENIAPKILRNSCWTTGTESLSVQGPSINIEGARSETGLGIGLGLLYVYIYMYMYMYMYMYICIYVYMYICIYVYMYICIYVYTHLCPFFGRFNILYQNDGNQPAFGDVSGRNIANPE